MMRRAVKTIGFCALMLVFAAQAQAQKDEYKYPSDPKDSTKCVENQNVFDNQFSQGNFSDIAVGAWRWCYENCPESNRLIFQGGEDYYEHMIKKAKAARNDSLYQAYIDTLIQVYERRLEIYGQHGDSALVTGKMAIALYKFRNNRPEALKKIISLVRTHNRLAGDKRIYAMPQVQFGAIDRLVRVGQMDTSKIVDIYIEQIDFIKAEAAKEDEGSKAKWTKTLDDVEKVMNKYLTCDVLTPLYDRMMKENKNLSKEQLKTMVSMLQYKGCDESDVYFAAAEKLCAIEPNSACKIALGDKSLKDKNISAAKSFYNQALELEKDNTIKQAAIWLKIAGAEQQGGAYSSAVAAAQKAVSRDPSLGKAYLIMAASYTKIANANCNSDMFDRAATNWVIVDYYVKAKNADPNLTEIADRSINNHSPHFPTKEEIFFKELKVGQSYTIPCIGISTIVRARKV